MECAMEIAVQFSAVRRLRRLSNSGRDPPTPWALSGPEADRLGYFFSEVMPTRRPGVRLPS
jgi:hypothetical protein